MTTQTPTRRGSGRVTGLFRVDPKDEEEGLDHSYHGGSAYGDTTGEFKPTYSKVRSLL